MSIFFHLKYRGSSTIGLLKRDVFERRGKICLWKICSWKDATTVTPTTTKRVQSKKSELVKEILKAVSEYRSKTRRIKNMIIY